MHLMQYMPIKRGGVMSSSFFTLIIVVWILILFGLSLQKNGKRNYKNEIVSLGVLGTFVGIAIGLLQFDATDIKGSIAPLLEGLKTAFITSGVGIFFSIIVSIFKPIPKARSEALQALEIVVAEFNHNLTSQFGDNFKELNSAVKAMIMWQENYKTQLKESEQTLNSIIMQLNQVQLYKKEEQESIQALIKNLENSSYEVSKSLHQTSDIVKEQFQLLIREANGKLS